MAILRDNPIFWREGVPRFLRNADTNVRLLVGVGLGGLSLICAPLLTNVSGTAADLLPQFIAWLWAGLSLLLVPSHTSRAIIQERLQGTWDGVLLTRLRPIEIVLGKLFAVLIPLWLLGLLFLSLCVVCASASPDGFHNRELFMSIGLAYAFAVIGGFSFGAIGLLFSLRCGSIWASQLATYTFVFLSLAGMPFVVLYNDLTRGYMSPSPQTSPFWGAILVPVFGVAAFFLLLDRFKSFE